MGEPLRRRCSESSRRNTAASSIARRPFPTKLAGVWSLHRADDVPRSAQSRRAPHRRASRRVGAASSLFAYVASKRAMREASRSTQQRWPVASRRARRPQTRPPRPSFFRRGASPDGECALEETVPVDAKEIVAAAGLTGHSATTCLNAHCLARFRSISEVAPRRRPRPSRRELGSARTCARTCTWTRGG